MLSNDSNIRQIYRLLFTYPSTLNVKKINATPKVGSEHGLWKYDISRITSRGYKFEKFETCSLTPQAVD